MAAGHLSSYRRNEFRDRESDLVSKRDFYQSKSDRGNHHGRGHHHDSGRGNKYAIQQKDSRKREEIDDWCYSRLSSGDSGKDGQYNKVASDKELGEISPESGSNGSVVSASVNHREVSVSETEDIESPLPSRKKRKLSPSPTGPFSLQKHSPAKDSSGSICSSVVSPSCLSSSLHHELQGSSYRESGLMSDDAFLSGRKVSASRWADEEGEISEDEGIHKRGRRSTSSECLADDEVDVSEDDENNGVSNGYYTDSEDEGLAAADIQLRSINMLHSCGSVEDYEKLNKIGAGTYGVVHRARDKRSGEIVALKKVKMEREREGFPLTALREINILLSSSHPSIVDVKGVVVKEDADDRKNKTYLVMEYMEHDLKGVIERMKYPFSQSEVKCLMLQLLEGVKFLHDNWVLHRDLKTSNILLNNSGELKICDFGMSRQYGSPLKPYTPLVVSLWYRAPELLLDVKQYSTAIDMWSLGCIMAELLAKKPLFKGESEIDQLNKIFEILGTPNEATWPGFSELPGCKLNFARRRYNSLREKFPPASFTGSPILSAAGFDLLSRLLACDPKRRITAEEAVNHEWFREVPLPKAKEFMPTFPVDYSKAR